MLSLTGRGAAAQRSALEGDQGLALKLTDLSLPVVRRYKYLGTVLDDSSTFHGELLHRASSARQAIFRARARFRDTS
eukprot:2719630-Prorocentrum_lima.AAC.1